MKILHIHAKSNQDIIPLLKKVKLKGKIGVVTTIQYLHQLKKAEKILKNYIIGGQILGCDISNATKIKNKVNSFLYIGSGNFHPLAVALKTNKPVYVLNPTTEKFHKLPEKDIKEYKQKLKGKLTKFYSSDKIGIIVCTKPGQYNLRKALELKKKLNKESFIFLCNKVDERELENFKDIDFWINTACPRIDIKGVISAEYVVPNI